MLTTFFSGMGVGASLIIAIGAQNAFVLGQGLRRQYPIMVALICALCDAILIAVGVGGVGAFISSNALWTDIMAWGGAIFLGWYGFNSFRSLFSDHSLKKDQDHGQGRKKIILFTLAITLLNPHVYLDTVVLLGGIGAQYDDAMRPIFASGAITASFLWFFTISLGAFWLSPYLARPITWKIIDGVTGTVMWIIAYLLISQALK